MNDEAIRRYKAGKAAKTLAVEHGVSRRVFRRFLHHSGVDLRDERGRGGGVPPETHDLAQRLYDAGLTQREIAPLVGVSRKTLQLFLRPRVRPRVRPHPLRWSWLWSQLHLEGDCWVWPGRLSSSGYARLTLNGKAWQLHRFVYELMVGSIPEGLQLDHLCRVRSCVNPWHLDPVTSLVNTRRGCEARRREAA